MRSKSHYITLRNQYRSPKIKTILVLESPAVSANYFYNPTGRTTEPLFSAIMKVIGESPAAKEKGLAAFARIGFFLVDATYQPVNHINNKKKRNEAILSALPELTHDLREIIGNQGVKIILVKANICRLLEEPLTAAGFNVINNGTIVPFPSHGNQTKFHQAIQWLLESNVHF
jgi:hypothetical protein